MLDREIDSIEADAFGHNHFAALLEGYIESGQNEPPYSIGLLGKWGSGKSSIKSLYLSSLADDTSSTPEKKPRRQRIYPITFNAWRFGGEDIKRALLRQVYLELGGDPHELEEALFRHVQRSKPEKREIGEILRDVFDQWGWSLVQVLLVFVVVIGTVAGIVKLLGLSGDQAIGWLLGASVVVAGAMVKFLLDTSRIPRHANVTRVESPRSTAEEFEDMLIRQIQRFKAGKTDLGVGRYCERIAIFVDDLDRLSPEEMISGLDAVRTFMEIPKRQLPKGLGVVFVMSCDEDRIADALADKRHRISNPDLPGAVFTHADAHRFLDRIFQFRLEIPPLPKRDMRSYAQQALTGALPGLAAELERAGTTVETLIDRMIHVGVGTPRNALQIVNAFIQSWWIAGQRERDGAGTDRPGGLQEGAVTGHPLALGAVCVLRVDFPDFYRDLQHQPELIRRFSEVYIHGLSLEDQPEPVQSVLRRYGGTDKTVLLIPHRPLRQYLASLEGLRWPRSLRPLLFLSQDPVTRRFGDKALSLYEAFVSGDHQGVLSELGRAHDTKPLSETDMRLLHDMVEELDAESDVRRNNAAAVLASLSDRYPSESAHLLLSRLARRLAEAPELRWRLGVANIGNVIQPAGSDDRREVASRLIDDLLKTKGEIDFRLPTGELPSLDEAMEMAEQACSLVLTVRRRDGLDQRSEASVLEWLGVRQVAVSGAEQAFPFSRLEDWMKEHEDWLLSAFGSRYARLVANQLEAEGAEQLDVPEVIRRVQVVFDSLLAAGEDSRGELWDHATRFVMAEEPQFVRFASEFVEAHVGKLTPDALNRFAVAFGNRLAGAADLDMPNRGQAFVNIVTARQPDLGTEAGQICEVLTTAWSNDNSIAWLATGLASVVCRRFPEFANSVVANWAGRTLSNLPGPCIDWLGQNFGAVLTDQQRTQVCNHLQPVVQRDNLAPEEGDRYVRLMSHLSGGAFESKPMQNHLKSIFDQIAQRPQNPNDYLFRVFPVVPMHIDRVPPGTVASTLQGLFSNTKGRPRVFGFLHGQMAGSWPEPKGELPGYNPDQLFTDALQVSNQHPAEQTMGGVLRSVTAMVHHGIVPKEREPEVAGSACRLWRHHPDDALASIRSLSSIPEASVVANMIDGLGGDQGDFSRLGEAWNVIAEHNTQEHYVAVATAILSKPPQGLPDHPDLCLTTWLNAKREWKQAVFQELTVAENLTDGQRKRVWLQIEQTQGLDMAFFLEVIPTIAGLAESPETVAEMLDYKDDVNKLFTSKQDRYALGESIAKAFKASSSQEAKNRLAAWLKELGVDAVLKKLPEYGELSEDELDMLKPHFAKSRYWKALAKK